MKHTSTPRQAAERVAEILGTDLGRATDAAAHRAEQTWHRLAPRLDTVASEAGHLRGRAVAASHEVPERGAAALAALRGRVGRADVERARRRRGRRRAGSVVALALLAAGGLAAWAWFREQSRYDELFDETEGRGPTSGTRAEAQLDLN
ncbi:DUF5324 family protein [Kitasatospora sp. NPDC088346]|uniref:DUF5324 family protein n=1 Tax=Kitasatospora sp. NPDC088346 TaxID=3364073 RepID=UPI0037FA09A7